MSILTSLINGAGGGVAKVIAEAIDETFTSEEEKLALEAKMKEANIEKEIKLYEALLKDRDSARKHDKASYNIIIVDFLRGITRPVITLTAFSFYVFAKVAHIFITEAPIIELSAYDYSVLGGILAFWFGGKFLGKDIQK